jgi:hypothetical protein
MLEFSFQKTLAGLGACLLMRNEVEATLGWNGTYEQLRPTGSIRSQHSLSEDEDWGCERLPGVSNSENITYKGNKQDLSSICKCLRQEFRFCPLPLKRDCRL